MSRLDEFLAARAVHLSIDMQNAFAKGGIWEAPWMERVVPVVVALTERFAGHTVFTRFVTPSSPDEMPGAWKSYYSLRSEVLSGRLDPHMVELVPELARFVPPARVFDKTRYSAFAVAELHAHLRERGIETLIVTGSETDMCVLASVLGAVDIGYRVVLVKDGICSSSDAGHDAQLRTYGTRFRDQVEIAEADAVLGRWRP